MFPSAKDYQNFLTSLSFGLWTIDDIIASEEYVQITGWARAPGNDFSNVSFTINNNKFGEIHYPLVRNDVGTAFSFDPSAVHSGFVCREYNCQFERGEEIHFNFIDAVSREPFRKANTIFYNPGIFSSPVPVPNEDMRKRISGNPSERQFIIIGYQIYKNCKLALERIFNKNFENFNHILDWGCGCGRITRHFPDIDSCSITGVDIDHDAIRWCNDNLPFGQYFAIPPYPPSSLKSSQYDLIIGISVLTHLNEETQFQWLRELHRISSDDGIVLLSVHGNTALCFSPPTVAQYHELEETGFLDAAPDPALNNVIETRGYYRSVYHTVKYINREWARYFDIIRILPGYIANHQDLVIMKKK